LIIAFTKPKFSAACLRIRRASALHLNFPAPLSQNRFANCTNRLLSALNQKERTHVRPSSPAYQRNDVGLFRPIMIEAGRPSSSLRYSRTAQDARANHCRHKGEPAGCRILLKGWSVSILLTKTGEQYAITPDAAAFLVRASPDSSVEMLGHLVNQLSQLVATQEVVQTGKPATASTSRVPAVISSRNSSKTSSHEPPRRHRLADALAGQLQSIAAPKPWTSPRLRCLGHRPGQEIPRPARHRRRLARVLPVTQKVAAKHGVAARLKTSPAICWRSTTAPATTSPPSPHPPQRRERSQPQADKQVFTALAPANDCHLRIHPQRHPHRPAMPLIFA